MSRVDLGMRFFRDPEFRSRGFKIGIFGLDRDFLSLEIFQCRIFYRRDSGFFLVWRFLSPVMEIIRDGGIFVNMRWDIPTNSHRCLCVINHRNISIYETTVYRSVFVNCEELQKSGIDTTFRLYALGAHLSKVCLNLRSSVIASSNCFRPQI